MCCIFPELWLPLDFPLCAASAFLSDSVCIVAVSVARKELKGCGARCSLRCAGLGKRDHAKTELASSGCCGFQPQGTALQGWSPGRARCWPSQSLSAMTVTLGNRDKLNKQMCPEATRPFGRIARQPEANDQGSGQAGNQKVSKPGKWNSSGP